MKAKKDGKLTTSPDPYATEDIGMTKLGNLTEYMDSRQQLSGLSDYPNYHMGAVPSPNMGQMPNNMPQNCIIPTYGGIIPKM